MAIKPTQEQQDVRNAFDTGDHVVVTALAGTGKTSTLNMCAQDHPRSRMTYVAFNRAIAEEAARKFPQNVTAKTMHAFAFAAVGHRFSQRLNGPRVRPAQVAENQRLPGRFEYGSLHLRDFQLARLVMDSVNRFCHSASAEPGPQHIAEVPGLDTEEGRSALEQTLVPFVQRAWDDLRSPNGRLKFNHDVYLKMYAMMSPKLPGEVVLADEWQDADPVIRQIVDGQDAQIVAVGDSNQQIYAWRGAVDALSNMQAPHRLPLQQSFRFGPEIAAEANRALALLQSPLQVVGTPTLDSRLAHLDVDSMDVVLTRTNAEAISLLMAAQVDGRRAGLVGGTYAVESLAKAAQELASGQKTTHPELLAFDTWAQVQDFVSEDSDARELATLVKLVDTHGPEALLAAVQRAVPEQHAELVISTAHKAKGREWQRVRLASDFQSPYDPEVGGVREDEVRLAYVALTRAQSLLDSSSLGWLGQIAAVSARALSGREAGPQPGEMAHRVFLDEDEVPPRPEVPEVAGPEPLGRDGEQLVIDPNNPHRLLFRNTRYDPDMVAAQKELPRSRYLPNYEGEERIRACAVGPEALAVAQRFRLRVAPEVLAAVEALGDAPAAPEPGFVPVRGGSVPQFSDQ